MWLVCWSICHPSVNCVDVCSACGISSIRSNFQRECYFHHCSKNHRYCSLPNCYLLVSRSQCISNGSVNDNSFGTCICSLDITWGRQTNCPDILLKYFLAFRAWRSASEQSATPTPSCKESPLTYCKVSSLVSSKVRGTPLSVEALDSRGPKFWWRSAWPSNIAI